MSVFALVGLVVAQLQVAPTVAELVDPILDHIDYPERLAERSMHLDVEAIRQSFGEDVAKDASFRLEDLAIRHRTDNRLRPGAKSDVIQCREVPGRFDACRIGEDDGLFVSVTEAEFSSGPGEIRVLVRVAWTDAAVLRGYYVELFLGKDPQRDRGWSVVDTGIKYVS